MIHRSSGVNAFEFVMVAVLRSAQLERGCVARVPKSHRSILTAQLETAAGKVCANARGVDAAGLVSVGHGLESVVARGERR